MYQVDLVEATGGDGNFYPDIQPDDKKLLEGMSLEGTEMGFFPTPELLRFASSMFKSEFNTFKSTEPNNSLCI